MQKNAYSNCYNGSSRSDRKKYHRAGKHLHFWEQTPHEPLSRAVSIEDDISDKRILLEEAVKQYLKDGMSIAMGGFSNTRTPVAAIYEIIRQGARDLTLIFQSNSICSELFAGAMILNSNHLSVRRIELAWNDDKNSDTSPLLRHLINDDLVELKEYSNESMTARFKAGAMGVPFLPIQDHDNGDKESSIQGEITVCPFTGKTLNLVPACNPDLALIHVQAADMFGNSRLFGPHYICPEIARASVNTIISTEQVIPTSNIQNYPNLTVIPSPVVDAVVDQPFGATPGTCYGNYGIDMAEIKRFREICEEFLKKGNKEKLKLFYDQRIFNVADFDDLLERKPYPVLQNLCLQDGGQLVILD